ncbi:MAG: ribonuclease [Faecalibacterium sp.]|nr:ribonuclease [Faecalibacterium sp.]
MSLFGGGTGQSNDTPAGGSSVVYSQSDAAQSTPADPQSQPDGGQSSPAATPADSSPAQSTPVEHPANSPPADTLDENGSYDSKEEVALYIHLYGRLPGNYITKKQAEALGWQGGSVERYAPGKCIGGSSFGNREGLLPTKKGRSWTECDIDTLGKSSRGAKRIVFSNDGLIYYTPDHYESFELLYGEE